MNEQLNKKNTDYLIYIASKAALSVKGVASLDNAPIPLNIRVKGMSKGVILYVSDNTLIFDIFLLVDFGVNIPQVAFNVQEKIKKTIEKNCTIEINKINIHIQGIQF